MTMNAQKNRNQHQRNTDMAGLAPHANPRWVEDFIVELRLLDVPGDRIGDALATVEEHLVDTRESVEEAFGSPRDYAASIAESEPRTEGVDAATVISSGLGIFGIVVAPRALTAFLDNTQVSVTNGDLAALALLIALLGGVVAFAGPLMRAVVERRTAGFVLWLLGFLGVTGAMVAFFLLWQAVVFTVSAWVVGAIALAGVVAAAWLGWRQSPDVVATPDGRTLGTRSAGRLTSALLVPVLTLVTCLMAFMTWALA